MTLEVKGFFPLFSRVIVERQNLNSLFFFLSFSASFPPYLSSLLCFLPPSSALIQDMHGSRSFLKRDRSG